MLQTPSDDVTDASIECFICLVDCRLRTNCDLPRLSAQHYLGLLFTYCVLCIVLNMCISWPQTCISGVDVRHLILVIGLYVKTSFLHDKVIFALGHLTLMTDHCIGTFDTNDWPQLYVYLCWTALTCLMLSFVMFLLHDAVIIEGALHSVCVACRSVLSLVELSSFTCLLMKHFCIRRHNQSTSGYSVTSYHLSMLWSYFSSPVAWRLNDCCSMYWW